MKAQFTFHPERCVGCAACVMACINENQIDVDKQNPFRQLKCNEYVDGDAVEVTYFTHGCMHCKEHPCLTACPRGCFAYDETLGVVKLDRTDCIGCHACARVCPFDAIQFAPDNKAIKCNGCIRNLRRDRLPACVMACPRRALTADEKNDVVKQGLCALQAELQQYQKQRAGSGGQKGEG